MLPPIEIAPPDERDLRFDAAAAQFAAPLARLALALEDERTARAALLDDIHVMLWRSLADYDERIGLRTWVFRVAHHAVSKHVPNTQERPPQQETVKQAWARWRLQRNQRTLDKFIAPAGATIEVLRGLKAFDREIALLYLEGFTVEEAVDVCGMPAARLEAAYQRIARLLPSGAREVWQSEANGASPVTRFLVHSRIEDVITRRRRQATGLIVGASIFMALMLARILLETRGRWLPLAALAVFTFLFSFPTIQLGRKIRSAEVNGQPNPATAAFGLLDSTMFQRQLLERERDQLGRSFGWQGWTVILGLSLLLLSFPLERHTGWGMPLVGFGLLIVGALVFVLVNRGKVKQLQAQIDAGR